MLQDDVARLVQLLRAAHVCIHVPTLEEPYALDVIRTAAMDLRWHGLQWSVTTGLRDALVRDEHTIPDTVHPAGALTHLCQHTPAQTVLVMLDLIPHLKDERTLRCLRELVPRLADVHSSILLVDPCDELPPAIGAIGTRFDVRLPGVEELEDIVRRTVRQQHERNPVKVQLRREDLDAIVQNLQGLTRSQARQAIIETICDDRQIDAGDLKRIHAFKKRTLRSMGVLEPIETFTTMDEIGGLRNLKRWLELRRDALSERAIEFGLEPPRGMLMLGVQGAGKSLSAKAVATAWKLPLVRMDVGALFDRFVGESERRLRDALRQAEMMSPVVLWIDEIEKAFAAAAAQSVDGGLSKRMFGNLLTWMQEHTRPVFIIATANDVSALPPELLRKGRFDEIFFIDLPGPEARRQIWEIHLKKRQRDPERLDMDKLVNASEGFSGAEIEQAIKNALYMAFARGALLGTTTLLDALRQSPPLSVTMAEKVAALRAWAQTRCAPAD